MKEAAETYYRITGYRAGSVEEIHGGLNSRNFLIDGKFVLRIKKATIDSGYDPASELVAEKAVAGTGLAPVLLHFDKKNGLKMTSFISGTHFIAAPPSAAEIRLVARAVKKLHGLPIEGLPPFDAFKRLDSYATAAGYQRYSSIEEKIFAHVRRLMETEQSVFGHNDLVRGNLLFKDDKLYIIDYEYAGGNHPLFDLASFITENDIDDPILIDAFLAEYYGEDPIPRADFTIFCRFLDYLWFYWAQGMYKKTGQSIYKTIAHIKQKRISRH